MKYPYPRIIVFVPVTYYSRFIGTTIIDKKYLKIIIGLRNDTVDTVYKILGYIVNRNNDGDKRVFHIVIISL